MSAGGWDVLILQAGGMNEIQYACNFIDQILPNSPNCRVYIMGHYPYRQRSYLTSSTDSYSNIYLSPINIGFGRTKAVFEAFCDSITQRYPGRPRCAMIGVGEVFYELERVMKLGQMPGFTSAWQLYDHDSSDAEHLNDTGMYVEQVTHFATLYSRDPHGVITRNLQFWHHPINVDTMTARIIWDAVWRIVPTYRYTDVSITGPRILTAANLGTAPVDAPWSLALRQSGGKGTISWTRTSGTLPAGISLSTSTGILSGTATTAGTSTFTIRVDDNDAGTTTRDSVNFTLRTALPAGPAITTTVLAPAMIGKAYSFTLIALGGTAGRTWALQSGTLPAGLTLNPATGVISGTTSTITNVAITVAVTDSRSRTATKALTIASVTAPTSGLTREEYYATWPTQYGAVSQIDSIDMYESRQRSRVGYVDTITLANAQNPTNYCMRFLGAFYVEQEGDYLFSVQSDDMSALYIDSDTILLFISGWNNYNYAVKHLTPGFHSLTQTYYQGDGGATLKTRWRLTGPGADTTQRSFAANVLYRTIPTEPPLASVPVRVTASASQAALPARAFCLNGRLTETVRSPAARVAVSATPGVYVVRHPDGRTMVRASVTGK